MLHVVLVEGVVVGKPVRELDVDGWEPGLHQFQIDQQTPGTAITVDEGVDALKLDVEPGQLGDNMLGTDYSFRRGEGQSPHLQQQKPKAVCGTSGCTGNLHGDGCQRGI